MPCRMLQHLPLDLNKVVAAKQPLCMTESALLHSLALTSLNTDKALYPKAHQLMDGPLTQNSDIPEQFRVLQSGHDPTQH